MERSLLVLEGWRVPARARAGCGDGRCGFVVGLRGAYARVGMWVCVGLSTAYAWGCGCVLLVDLRGAYARAWLFGLDLVAQLLGHFLGARHDHGHKLLKHL